MKKILSKVFCVVGIVCVLFSMFIVPSYANTIPSFPDDIVTTTNTIKYIGGTVVVGTSTSPGTSYGGGYSFTPNLIFGDNLPSLPNDYSYWNYSIFSSDAPVENPPLLSIRTQSNSSRTKLNSRFMLVSDASTSEINAWDEVVVVFEDNLIYDRKNPQGALYFGKVSSDSGYVDAQVFYEGVLAYPRIDGDIEPIPYEFIFDYQNVTESGNHMLRTSFFPAKMNHRFNPTYIDLYSHCFNSVSSDLQGQLEDPSILTDAPILLLNSSVSFNRFGASDALQTQYFEIDDYVDYNQRPTETLEYWAEYVGLEPDINDFNFFSFVRNLISSFLEIELFPGFKLYMPLALCIAIACITWLLKAFAGG